MPRANRYFLPGHVWHITHRCHKKENNGVRFFINNGVRVPLGITIVSNIRENCDLTPLNSKERPQRYSIAQPAQRIDIGNYIVCAKVGDKNSLGKFSYGDVAILYVYCAPKQGEPKILPISINGYALNIMKGKQEIELTCIP